MKKQPDQIDPKGRLDVEESLNRPSSEVDAARGRVHLGFQAHLLGFFERWGVILCFALVFLIFSILSPEVFPTWSNVTTILEQTGIVILLAVGLTFVLASGEFDLTFPNVFVLVTGIVALSMTKWGLGPVPAVAVGLGVGIVTGLITGSIVATQRASSFIVTLALGSVYTGLMYAIAGTVPIVSGIPESYGDIANLRVDEVSSVVITAIVVAVLAGTTMRSTIFGREVYATGSNPAAATVAGVNVTRVRIGTFVVSGFCVAIAGILQSSLSLAHYPEGGSGLFLPPFVAAFIGTSVLGRGRFNVVGTVVGALFISTLQTGLIVQNTASWVLNLLEGLVLLTAVLISRRTRRA